MIAKLSSCLCSQHSIIHKGIIWSNKKYSAQPLSHHCAEEQITLDKTYEDTVKKAGPMVMDYPIDSLPTASACQYR